MHKRLLRQLIVRKYGLPGLILLMAAAALGLGYWLGLNNAADTPPLPPELKAEEERWLKGGKLFGDGIYVVGSDIAAGIYRTKGEGTSLYGCRWQRLAGFAAEQDNLIASYVEDQGMATIVEIESSDKGFKTEGCGWWYAESIPVAESSTTFGDGAFIVGRDIEPGIYTSHALSTAGCRWERLGGLSRISYDARIFGQDPELLAQSRNLIVEIKPDDRAFVSYKCLKWTPELTSST